jgi:hypothetical protein
MYFESKFDKVFTTLLSMQQKRGATLTLQDQRNPFWKIEKGAYRSDGKEELIVQPLVMFNTITSSNIEDVVIQDSDVSIDKTDQKYLVREEGSFNEEKHAVESISPYRADQEIICENRKDTRIVASFNAFKRPNDDNYVCRTGMQMRGDTVHKALEPDYLGDF